MVHVTNDAYRIEFVQVQAGCLWAAVKDASTQALPYVTYGEYEVASISAAGNAEAALKPPVSREGALSVHLMPLFVWNVDSPGLQLDPVAANEVPLLAVFALKVAMDWPQDVDITSLRPRAHINTVFGVAEQVKAAMAGAPHYAVCGGIGFFEIIALLQTNRVSDVRDTLEQLHRMTRPPNHTRPAFCAVSPVCGMRAVAQEHGEHRTIGLPNLKDVTGELGAHVCLGYRPGKYDTAVQAANACGPNATELLVARYDIEAVFEGKSMSEIAQVSIGLHADLSGPVEYVRTALSFPLRDEGQQLP